MTPRRSRGRRLVLVAVAAVALVVAGCSEVKNNKQNSLQPKSPQAQKIYDPEYPAGGRYYWKSTNLAALSEEVVEVLVEQTLAAPSNAPPPPR